MRKLIVVLMFAVFLAVSGCAVAANTSPPDGCVLQMPPTEALQADQFSDSMPYMPINRPELVELVCVMDVVVSVPEWVQALPAQLSDGYAEAPDHVPVVAVNNREKLFNYRTSTTQPNPLPGGV